MADKKKQKKAVALTYRPEKDGAPTVAASGRGKMAEKIIETAREYGIPVKDDPDLVEVLSKLDVTEEIPPNVYVVVAELLAFAYSLNGKKAPV
jgi:flagellar biosynthesis protein